MFANDQVSKNMATSWLIAANEAWHSIWIHNYLIHSMALSKIYICLCFWYSILMTVSVCLHDFTTVLNRGKLSHTATRRVPSTQEKPEFVTGWEKKGGRVGFQYEEA